MKLAMTALAVVLLAGAAPALAQPDGHGWRAQGDDRRAEKRHDHPQRDGDGGRPARQARPPPVANRAPEAARAPQVSEPRATRGERERSRAWGDSVRRPGVWAQNPRRPEAPVERRWDGDRGKGERRAWTRPEGDRRTWDRREDGRFDWDRNTEGRRRYDGGAQVDRRDSYRRDGDRRYDDRRYDDRRYEGRRYDGRRDGYARWERGRYPHVYASSHRYHHRWRPPAGYYARVWAFGDFIPGGWYGPDWWIIDPWLYGLPLPPPGYDWVRVGDDALLVDVYTGLVIQVVRDVFW